MPRWGWALCRFRWVWPTIPVAEVRPELLEALPCVKALPTVMATLASHPRTMMPWGQAISVSQSFGNVGSFGNATCDEQLIHVQERLEVVEAARAKTLARRQITHYKCMSCRVLVPNEEQKCSNCGYIRGEGGALVVQEREKARAASRQHTVRGRRRNMSTSANVAPHSLDVVPHSAFEREWSVQIGAKKQRISQEPQYTW